jgi:hypothetical protein
MITKNISIAALLTVVLCSAALDYRIFLSCVITISAVAAITQAVRARKPAWAILFVAIAAFPNPSLTGALLHPAYWWTDLACLAVFVASLVVLKNKPVLSIAPITDRTPGSESL